MPEVEVFEITSKESKDLLKDIETELAHTKLGERDSNGNREYQKGDKLQIMIRQLLVNLKLGVRGDDATNTALKRLTTCSI